MMEEERRPLVHDSSVEQASTTHSASSASSASVAAPSNPHPHHDGGETGGAALNILSNGYDDLVSSLVHEDNIGFNNIHFTSLVGIVKISMGGIFLGLVLGIHLTLFVYSIANGKTAMLQWCLYVFSMFVFHVMEFLNTAAFKPRDVSFDSYLLNHSTAYIAAAVASWVEFWFELWLLPSMKGSVFISLLAFLLVAGFQTIRSSAMITAGRNFNHIVQDTAQSDGHDLVTIGVYKHLRHPAYFGWFWWSISTQVLLCNPVCVIAYAYASFKFFESRIYHEERYLYHEIFPNKYGPYCRTSKIGIPFVKGYVDTLQE